MHPEPQYNFLILFALGTAAMLVLGGGFLLIVIQNQKRVLKHRLDLEQAEREKQMALQELLQSQKEELEQKVHIRTAELTHANTVLKNAMEELNATQEHLIQNEKMASLGALIRNVSHELNNPIGAIRANTSLLQSQLPDLIRELPELLLNLTAEERKLFEQLLNAASQDSIQNLSTRDERVAKKALQTELENAGIGQAADRANQLVQCGFIDAKSLGSVLHSPSAAHVIDATIRVKLITVCFSNLNASVDRTRKIVGALRMFYPTEQLPGTNAVNIKEGIEKALGAHTAYFSNRLQLHTHFLANPIVVIDPEHLSLLLNHLLFNAIQSIGSGSGDITITLTEDERNAIIHIHDNGPGIPENLQAKIFQPFFTTKKSGEGSGLGLYLSRRITDIYKGSIQVTSKPADTTFTVTLPKTNIKAI